MLRGPSSCSGRIDLSRIHTSEHAVQYIPVAESLADGQILFLSPGLVKRILGSFRAVRAIEDHRWLKGPRVVRECQDSRPDPLLL